MAKPRAADPTRIPDIMLAQGLARDQRCPLHRGRKYRWIKTGQTVTYHCPAIGPGRVWTGKVSVSVPGEFARCSVAPSQLEEVCDAA